MTAVPRDVFDAKIEAIEARMDARIESTHSKIDATNAKLDATAEAIHDRVDHFLAAQAERDQRYFEGQAIRDRQLEALTGEVRDMAVEMRTGFSSLRTTILVTAVTATLAIVFGVASFNASLTSNMLAAFQMGKSLQPAPAIAALPPVATAETPAQPAD